jgi:hypothetical protein
MPYGEQKFPDILSFFITGIPGKSKNPRGSAADNPYCDVSLPCPVIPATETLPVLPGILFQ